MVLIYIKSPVISVLRITIWLDVPRTSPVL